MRIYNCKVNWITREVTNFAVVICRLYVEFTCFNTDLFEIFLFLCNGCRKAGNTRAGTEIENPCIKFLKTLCLWFHDRLQCLIHQHEILSDHEIPLYELDTVMYRYLSVYITVSTEQALWLSSFSCHTNFFSVLHIIKAWNQSTRDWSHWKSQGERFYLFSLFKFTDSEWLTQGFKPLTIVSKSFIMVVCQSSKYVFSMRTCSILLCADPKPE